MLKFKNILIAICIMCMPTLAFCSTLDKRIREYAYESSAIYELQLKEGFETSIQFAEGEELRAIRMGQNYFSHTAIKNLLFIKPEAASIKTNITVITNKGRVYRFYVTVGTDPVLLFKFCYASGGK